MTDGVWMPGASFNKDERQWPLLYSMNPPSADETPRKYWNHYYYRGPQNRPAQILYSTSASHSEVIARTFLNEPVLGFDMEWPLDADRRKRPQDKVALIQVACERRIALFHIALHDGQTSHEIIAPSLRRIIESPDILKVGVAILTHDFKRLKEIFKLQPRGAFELSHLHRLVCSGPPNYEKVTTKLCAMAEQVERHLGLPLYKGSVRTSDWSKPLSESQRTYAANDAYAGYMLFHCMNAKRLEMTPAPRLPKLAESYLAFGWSNIVEVQLEPVADGAEDVSMVAKQLTSRAAEGGEKQDDKGEVEARCPSEAGDSQMRGEDIPSVHAPPKSESSSKLLAQLFSHRRITAAEQDLELHLVAPNKVLEALAEHRPVNKSQLLEIYGIGEFKVKAYGDDWLRIIAQHLAEYPEERLANTTIPLQPTAANVRLDERRDDKNQPLTPVLSRELFNRLAQHRKTLAGTRNWAAFRVTSNRILEDLVRRRPSTERELLLVDGVGERKVAENGPAWLQIIASFQAEHELGSSATMSSHMRPVESVHPEEPQLSNVDVKRPWIKNVGRSKELILSQPPLSTGLSFQFAETGLAANEAPAEGNDEDAHDELDNSTTFGNPTVSPTSSPLKRKRVDT
ncbi:ribonuclease H-like domain-containing protein [Hypoxylon crocopeplum]|nr:ribonuclease H-like domain-containing protein [Hypoxylon crocopeplum]